MRTKLFIVAAFAVMVCVFTSGYCLAKGEAPAKVQNKDSGAISVPGKSVIETEKAALSAKSVVEMKNAVESTVTTTVKNVDGKRVVDIYVPEGKELLIDKPIYGDVINISGSGSIRMIDSGGINNGKLPQPVGNTNPGAGVNVQPGQNGSVVQQEYVAGAMKIPGIGSTMSGTFTIVEEAGGIKEPPVFKKPALTQSKGAPRMGPGIGTTMETPISKPQPADKPAGLKGQAKERPFQNSGGATLGVRTTIDDDAE